MSESGLNMFLINEGMIDQLCELRQSGHYRGQRHRFVMKYWRGGRKGREFLTGGPASAELYLIRSYSSNFRGP